MSFWSGKSSGNSTINYRSIGYGLWLCHRGSTRTIVLCSVPPSHSIPLSRGALQDGRGQQDQRPTAAWALDVLLGPHGYLPYSPNCQGAPQVSSFSVEWQNTQTYMPLCSAPHVFTKLLCPVMCLLAYRPSSI